MSEIPKLNQEIMEACQLYVDNLIKPIHSLGKLEDMAVRMAGILGEVKPTYLNKAVVIFGGDTAVDGENKTKGQLSHAEMKLVAQGAGPVNVLARQMEMPVYLVDVGLERIPPISKAYWQRRRSMVRIRGIPPWMMMSPKRRSLWACRSGKPSRERASRPSVSAISESAPCCRRSR